MSDHVYKIVELVGSSPTGIEDAIQGAIARASSTIDHSRWGITVDYGGLRRITVTVY